MSEKQESPLENPEKAASSDVDAEALLADLADLGKLLHKNGDPLKKQLADAVREVQTDLRVTLRGEQLESGAEVLAQLRERARVLREEIQALVDAKEKKEKAETARRNAQTKLQKLSEHPPQRRKIKPSRDPKWKTPTEDELNKEHETEMAEHAKEIQRVEGRIATLSAETNAADARLNEMQASTQASMQETLEAVQHTSAFLREQSTRQVESVPQSKVTTPRQSSPFVIDVGAGFEKTSIPPSPQKKVGLRLTSNKGLDLSFSVPLQAESTVDLAQLEQRVLVVSSLMKELRSKLKDPANFIKDFDAIRNVIRTLIAKLKEDGVQNESDALAAISEQTYGACQSKEWNLEEGFLHQLSAVGSKKWDEVKRIISHERPIYPTSAQFNLYENIPDAVPRVGITKMKKRFTELEDGEFDPLYAQALNLAEWCAVTEKERYVAAGQQFFDQSVREPAKDALHRLVGVIPPKREGKRIAAERMYHAVLTVEDRAEKAETEYQRVITQFFGYLAGKNGNALLKQWEQGGSRKKR
jgi:6-pyruvoyl-tetrahydropterin synthase